jgi:hypothetical protein
MIMNCLISTGSPNFIKRRTNKDMWLVLKMLNKTSIKLLTKILTAVHDRLKMYCATVSARIGVNQMWILKNSKETLERVKSPIFSQIYSINTYDSETFCPTTPHDKLKTGLFGIIGSCFLCHWDECPESYCHNPGVGVGVSFGVTQQWKKL